MLLKRVTVTVIYILLKRNGNDDRFLEISRPESKLKFVEEKFKRETNHFEKN